MYIYIQQFKVGSLFPLNSKILQSSIIIKRLLKIQICVTKMNNKQLKLIDDNKYNIFSERIESFFSSKRIIAIFLKEISEKFILLSLGKILKKEDGDKLTINESALIKIRNQFKVEDLSELLKEFISNASQTLFENSNIDDVY